MHHAYLDESGNTAPFQAAERFLVVAVVVASDKMVRALALHVKHMRKRGGIKDSEEQVIEVT